MEKKENLDARAVETLHKTTPPIIVDLGSRKKKAIKDLKNGTGELLAEVELAVEEVHSRLPTADKNKQVLPVLVIYKEKGKKKNKGGLFPFSPLSPFNLFR